MTDTSSPTTAEFIAEALAELHAARAMRPDWFEALAGPEADAFEARFYAHADNYVAAVVGAGVTIRDQQDAWAIFSAAFPDLVAPVDRKAEPVWAAGGQGWSDERETYLAVWARFHWASVDTSTAAETALARIAEAAAG